MTGWIFVESIEPFTTESLEKCWSWLSKPCDKVDRATNTRTEATLWILFYYFMQEFLLFSIPVCGKDDAMFWEFFWHGIADND